MGGLEIIKSKRMVAAQQEITPADVIPAEAPSSPATRDKLMNAVADNFDNIVNLAADYMEIQKMQMQSQAVIAQMQETRKQLVAEAEAYAIKKNADTNNIVQRMNVIRDMMNDFYLNGSKQPLTSEDFCKIITEIVTQMGRISENG